MSKFNLSKTQEETINKLLAQMTIEEKVGQMHQLSPSIVGGFDVSFEELIEMVTDGRISNEEFGKIMASAERDFHEDDIRAGKVGSYLLNDPKKANELQRIAVEESRLGIPLIYGFDVIHGFRTTFPIPLAEACTWNEKVFEASAEIAAREASAHGIHWTFAPMLDIARDARWGRISESAGEDPYLGSVYARAKVRGFQGADPSDREHIAATLKHFAAYGAVESGQDYNTVSMANSMLHNGYLPPFQAAVEEGALTVMAAFNDYNGIPCTVNSYLLRKVLKDTYGFGGFVVSDANAIRECVSHGIAEDLADASRKAADAGMDMDMGSGAYHGHLAQQAADGEVSEEVLDEAVRRILTVKMALGLFEHPYVEEERMAKYDGALDAIHLGTAFDAAKRSIVLLKNDGILPLKKTQTVALAGALADDGENCLGAWNADGRGSDCITVKAGLERAGVSVTYAACCDTESEFRPAELAEAAKNADVIVAVVGETNAMSGEAASRADITLPGHQRELLKAALATGKPVVAVLMNGRPLALQWEQEHIPAIVESWQLGITHGDAVAAVLLGDYNPSGKLCATFPAVTGQCPRCYNHPNTGRPGSKSKFTSRYLDAPLEPLYPFGYGLSYSEFLYSDLIIYENADVFQVSVTITNTGSLTGEETAQLYLRDVTASIVRPVKELKAFRKVTLAPGEAQKITLIVKKCDMGFYNDDMEYCLEDGRFIFYVGGNSRDCLQAERYVHFL